MDEREEIQIEKAVHKTKAEKSIRVGSMKKALKSFGASLDLLWYILVFVEAVIKIPSYKLSRPSSVL